MKPSIAPLTLARKIEAITLLVRVALPQGENVLLIDPRIRLNGMSSKSGKATLSWRHGEDM